MAIRILLADDHRIVREALRALLQSAPDIEVVAEAENGESAVTLSAEHSPDVVVMDVAMPDLDGIEATRRIREARPETKVVALTAHTNPRIASEMLAAGASSYVPKVSAAQELVKAIQTVIANKVYLNPGIAEGLVNETHDGTQHGTQNLATAPTVITPREREVLQLTADGKAMKEIAALLNISIKTVETHRRQLMDKLGLYSVAELTKYALREGITSLDVDLRQ